MEAWFGGRGGGKLRPSREPTHAGGWIDVDGEWGVSVGGTRGGGGSFNVHANQVGGW